MNNCMKALLLCAILLSLIHPVFGGEMKLLTEKITIAGEDYFEWFPVGDYNSLENEFCLFYRISGFLDAAQVGVWMSGINGRRVSHTGDVIGDPIASITTPTALIQAWAKPAYNPFKNEYMVCFTQGQEISGWDIFVRIIDEQGNSVSDKIVISDLPAQGQHPCIVFNPLRKVYFLTWDDNRNGSNNDVFGILLKEDGSIDTPEFIIAEAPGDQIYTDMTLNPTDGSCLVSWEDFRHVPTWHENGDIYGALVSGTGEVIKKDITICDDFGKADEGDQRMQHHTYNSKANNFFVTWWDERPSSQMGGIYARIINADGEPAGNDFVLVDAPNPQIFCTLIYHEETDRIFAAWDDLRAAPPLSLEDTLNQQDKKDIYACWFNTDGTPASDEIPVETADGEQRDPKLIYNPLMDRFLIAWRNYNVQESGGGGVPIGGGHISEAPGNVDGVLYGMPSFMAARAVDKATGASVPDASIRIIGLGTMVSGTTNAGGWYNIAENNQRRGRYLIITRKAGYKTAFDFVQYSGEPLDMIMQLSPR